MCTVKESLSYAIYYLPDDDEMKLIVGKALYDVDFESEDSRKEGFIFAPYEVDESCPRILITNDISISGEEGIRAYLSNSTHKGANAKLSNYEQMSQLDYESAVASLVQDLKRDNNFQKAVLARTLEVVLPSGFNSFELLRKLKAQMPNAMCFLVNTPKSGGWIGATPERLLEAIAGKGYAVALAGTLPVDSQKDWSQKEIVEQRIVSDYVKLKLDNLGFKNIMVRECQTVVSGPVKHLSTVFEFDLTESLFIIKTINTLHPTPAVCGLPLGKAKAAISKYETVPRTYYTGYLGPLNIENESHIFVNLRSMQLLRDKALLYLGAGITEDSIPENEWIETNIKSQTLLNVFNN